jgi:hypothetical protein
VRAPSDPPRPTLLTVAEQWLYRKLERMPAGDALYLVFRRKVEDLLIEADLDDHIDDPVSDQGLWTPRWRPEMETLIRCSPSP